LTLKGAHRMLLLNNPPHEDRWGRLQELTPPSEIPPQFRVLLAALDLVDALTYGPCDGFLEGA